MLDTKVPSGFVNLKVNSKSYLEPKSKASTSILKSLKDILSPTDKLDVKFDEIDLSSGAFLSLIEIYIYILFLAL